MKKLAGEIWRVMEKSNYKADRETLGRIDGLGDAKISQILSCVELAVRMKGGMRYSISDVEPKHVWDKLADIRNDRRERFIILYLNSRNREITREVVSVGTINASIVHPREVFSKAVEMSAATVIGVHNHPSGEVEPSDADLAVTKRLVEAGAILGIEFRDHIIVSEGNFYSIRDNHSHLFD